MREHASLSAELALSGRAATTGFAEPGEPEKFAPDPGAEVHHIALRLDLDPERGDLIAEASLTLSTTPSAPGALRLQLADHRVERLRLDGQEVDWRHEDGVLHVPCPSAGEHHLEVHYRGRPRRGLYFIAPDEARPERPHQVWSQCQDQDGHFVFPCVDHPSARQRFSTVVIAPPGYVALSNGRAAGEETLASGAVAWRFEQEEPIPAYLFTVVVSPLRVVEDQHGALALRYLVPQSCSEADARRAFGRTPEMIAVLEARTGVAFPWARYDQVVVEDFIFGGMENVAATTMTSLILTDARAANDYDAERLVAHELGHQWFGDLVTCEDWSQAWLNEGWATACEGLWVEHARGEAHAAWYRWSQAQRYFSESESRYARPVVSRGWRSPIDLFDHHLYEKGACVLHTLRRELGDALFFDGVRRYLEARRLQSVHTLDLRRAMEQASGRSLERFFRQFIHAPGFPELEVRLSHEDGLLQVEVEQTQTGEGVPEAFWFTLHLEVVGPEGSQALRLPVRERKRCWALPASERPTRVRVDAGFNVLARVKLEGPRAWWVATLRDDACPVLRIRAAKALARGAHPDGVTALCDALSGDAEWPVRAELAKALGALGGPVARDALLKAVAQEPAAQARPAVMQALGRFPDDPAVAAALAAVVDQGDVSVLAEGDAGVSLGQLRAPQARAACEALLGRDAWADALRMRGLSGLGYSRDPSALPLLLDYTGPQWPPRVRGAAAAAIGQLAADLPDLSKDAVDALIELARHAPIHARFAAVTALGQAGDPRALPALQALHQRAEDGRLARSAHESIRRIRAARPGGDTTRDDLDALTRRFDALRARLDKLEPSP